MSFLYHDISTKLNRLNVPISASEAHGLLAGLLCCQPSALAKTRWFSELLDSAAMQANAVAMQAAELRSLDSWFTHVHESLNDAELGFTPLIPTDTQSLAERAQALCDFCAGFTYGVGIGVAGRGHKPFPKDTAELIEDFHKIDSMEADFVEVGDTDDAALEEILEYVRVGVLLIHEELQPVALTDKQVH